jgi:hypothetical protein
MNTSPGAIATDSNCQIFLTVAHPYTLKDLPNHRGAASKVMMYDCGIAERIHRIDFEYCAPASDQHD